jgi:phosphatidylglycerol:prolipoprotein diacylglycerol transferase
VTFTNPLAEQLVGTPLGVALEPTQLFESAVELANFFLLMWLIKRKKFDGQVFAAYLFLYGVARYFLEFLRNDPGRGEVFGGIMSGTQLISIGLVVLAGGIWYFRSSVPRPVPVTASR